MLSTVLNEEVQEFNVRLKELKKDSLTLRKENEFSLRNPASFTASTPIEKMDTSFMKLIDKDSLQLSFTTRLDRLKNRGFIDFERKEEQKYNLRLFPGAVTDFYGEKNSDTLSYTFSTLKSTQLGNFSITLKGGSSFPVIIQVTKKDLSVEAEVVANENGTYDIFYLTPGEYYIRVIYDTNANGKYDPGNFLKGIQPEEVVYNPELIKLQANWDRKYTLNLK
jgi:hypothetical protein